VASDDTLLYSPIGTRASFGLFWPAMAKVRFMLPGSFPQSLSLAPATLFSRTVLSSIEGSFLPFWPIQLLAPIRPSPNFAGPPMSVATGKAVFIPPGMARASRASASGTQLCTCRKLGGQYRMGFSSLLNYPCYVADDCVSLNHRLDDNAAPRGPLVSLRPRDKTGPWPSRDGSFCLVDALSARGRGGLCVMASKRL